MRRPAVRTLLLVGLAVVTGASSFSSRREEATPIGDIPYVWLTGFTEHELEELSYLPAGELKRRIGLEEVPGGFKKGEHKGRAAHAIASYLGTRRWGPNITIAMGYLREFVPAFTESREIDPVDIAANYAGVRYALEEQNRRAEARQAQTTRAQ